MDQTSDLKPFQPVISDETEVIIRQYGLLDPLDWGDDCDDELRRMNDLWNSLVETERCIQKSYTSLISNDDTCVFLGQINARYETRSNLINRRRSIRRNPSTKGEASQLSDAIKELGREITELRKSAVSARRDVRQRMASELRQLESSRRAQVKAARQNSGLWWGNYNAVVKTYERGRRKTLREGGELRPKSYDGAGRITNQIQGGMSVAELFEGAHSQVKVHALPTDAWSHPSRGQRRRLQRTHLTVTVFTREGERRTVTWPMVMHRPIPDDCLIKEVVVTRRNLGTGWRWQVVFTCTRGRSAQQLRSGIGIVAVATGWRLLSEGIRVATVVSDRGDEKRPSFLVLPRIIVDGFALIDSLRARRAALKNDVWSWLKGLDWRTAPDSLVVHVDSLRQVGSPRASQMASLVFRWRDYQEWDPENYRRLEEWRREDKRLLLWERNQREKLILRRTDLYRRLAREIVANASTVVLNRMDVATIGRLELPNGRENPLAKAARRYRTIAAISSLRNWIELQARKAGCQVYSIEASKYRICSKCGASEAFSSEHLYHTCSHCHSTWDKDVNSCRVMLTTEVAP